MKHGHFAWVDLSALDLGKAESFYSKVLGWQVNAGADGYHTGITGGNPVAGLFDMPEFFRKINMPSFWMSYIRVESVDQVVAIAKEKGGKVELVDEHAIGRIALIRDPAGAGFTCIEGGPTRPSGTPSQGQYIRSELFVSDLGVVQGFYEALFGWVFKADATNADRYLINSQGETVSAVQVVSNEIKGNKEYWGVLFGVNHIENVKKQVVSSGGSVVYDYQISGNAVSQVTDSQGGNFYLIELGKGSGREAASPAKHANPFKWRSFLGLIAVYCAVLLEADWVWGVLFLFWVIPDLKSGVTYFIEPVNRRNEPILYWLIMGTWLVLSAFLLLGPLLN